MDRCKWRKMIKEARWSGWVWVGECFFWYRPTRVVPDQRPLNVVLLLLLQSLQIPAVWLRRHLLHGVDSVHLQILLMGTCWQSGSWSFAGHNHRKVNGRDHICASFRLFYFTSAVVAVDSSRLTASSSALWSRFSPLSNYVMRWLGMTSLIRREMLLKFVLLGDDWKTWKC